ncbi:TPA: type 1 fimbrial protein [Klebsiella oxytoca]|nr:type 1 fimbrial protein [Klebsiella oxytoca]
MVTLPAGAGALNTSIYWPVYPGFNFDREGEVAGQCNFGMPDEKPLSIPRTLVVDKNTPNGTVVFSWGYGEFIPPLTLECVSAGNVSTDYLFDWVAGVQVYAPSDGLGIPLTDPGLRLRIYAKVSVANNFGNGLDLVLRNSAIAGAAPGLGNEYELTSPYGSNSYIYMIAETVAERVSGLVHSTFVKYGIASAIEFRAEIVKVGTLAYPVTNSVEGGYYMGFSWEDPGTSNTGNNPSFSTSNRTTDHLSGNGIRVVAPSCHINPDLPDGTNYSINMNDWDARQRHAPEYGPLVPVNIHLLCSGQTDHVRFRFEDTGASISANNNISLYDTAGGSKVNGLEIELNLNGTKVNVDNITTVDTGNHGSYKAPGVPWFDQRTVAPFQARYIQTQNQITKDGGGYSGPVTGKVNMYVTYD